MKIQQIKPYHISSKGGLKNLYPQISHTITPIADCYTGSKPLSKIKRNSLKNYVLILLSLFFGKLFVKNTPKKIAPSDLQQKIENGNKKVDLNAFKPLDINDPIFNDIEGATEYIVQKAEKQAGVITEKDIANSVNKLSKKYNIPEQEVIDIMAKLTQFGSYKQLKPFEKFLSENNICEFYNASKISLNRALSYIHKQKKQMVLPYKQNSKTAFILDDYSIEHLENLTFKTTLERYKKLFQSGKFVPIFLDGTSVNVDGKNYSYTAFDGGINLEALTEAVIIQKKEGKNDDEIFNHGYKERIRSLFGSEVADKILTVKLTEGAGSIKKIAEQLKPTLPDKQTLSSILKIILKYPEQNESKIFALKYMDNMMKIYSPETMSEVLKKRHKQLEEYVKSIGKTMEDVYYVTPCDDKSYNLVDYTYAKVNNIKPSRFINLEDTSRFPENSVAVVLDDIIGSGDSMLDDPFPYDSFVKRNKTTDVVFSTISTSKKGLEIINQEIEDYKKMFPSRNDVVLHDELNTSDLAAFKNSFNTDISNLIRCTVGYLGHISVGLCTAFPYMIPDNCSSLASYILDFCLLRGNAYANKALPDGKILSEIKVDIINNLEV